MPVPTNQVVVEGIGVPPMDAIAQPDGVHAVHFSPDGEHVASFGRFDGVWRPIVDGRVGPGGLGVGRAGLEDDLVSFSAVGRPPSGDNRDLARAGQVRCRGIGPPGGIRTPDLLIRSQSL